MVLGQPPRWPPACSWGRQSRRAAAPARCRGAGLARALGSARHFFIRLGGWGRPEGCAGERPRQLCEAVLHILLPGALAALSAADQIPASAPAALHCALGMLRCAPGCLCSCDGPALRSAVEKATEAGAHHQKVPAAAPWRLPRGLDAPSPAAAAGPVDLKKFGLFGLLELLLFIAVTLLNCWSGMRVGGGALAVGALAVLGRWRPLPLLTRRLGSGFRGTRDLRFVCQACNSIARARTENEVAAYVGSGLGHG